MALAARIVSQAWQMLSSAAFYFIYANIYGSNFAK